MPRQTVGIIVNGVTGRMGYRQHLVRSLLAIREQGGIFNADIWAAPGDETVRTVVERFREHLG